MSLIECALKAIEEDRMVYPTKPRLQSFLEWLKWYWDTQICLGYVVCLFFDWVDIFFKPSEERYFGTREEELEQFWTNLSHWHFYQDDYEAE